MTARQEEGYNELVPARGVPVHSVCKHREDARCRAEFFALTSSRSPDTEGTPHG